MSRPAKECDVAGCDTLTRSSTALYCNTHRLRIAKYGVPDLPGPTPLHERFWAKVDRGGEEECWTWMAGVDKQTGYGRMGRGRRDEGTISAHRAAYEIQVGPIPDGLTIDHLCLNRVCVNARHLEPVTLEENSRRAKRRWTHCIHGHEFTTENTYWRKEGRRTCRQCARDRKAAA